MRKVLFAFLLCLLLVVGLAQSRASSENYEVVAPYGPSPIIDGTISSSEWGNVSLSFAFTNVFIKQDGNNLYVAFNDTDDTNPNILFTKEDYDMIIFDVEYDRNSTLQPDDLWLKVERNGTLFEARVTEGQWVSTPTVSGWDARTVSGSQMWQCEFNIGYSMIGVSPGVAKTIGVVFASTHGVKDTPGYVYNWPPYGDETGWTEMLNNPSWWGILSSSEFDWVPEFPSYLASFSFMMATILSIVAFRGKKRLRAP